MDFIDILKEVYENFDESAYNYQTVGYVDYEDYGYNHLVNRQFIDSPPKEIESIDHIKADMEEGYYSDKTFFIFKYKDKFYKLEYYEGSHGVDYKVNLDSFKEVQVKTKEVVYYE